MSRSATPLSYDTAVGRPNRWVRRGLMLLAIAIAVGFGSVWIGPLWRQSQLLYWQHRCMVHVPSGQRYPKEWDRFAALASPPGIQSQGTLFLHELVSPAGHRRLVSVNLQTRLMGFAYRHAPPIPTLLRGSNSGRTLYLFDAWVIEPAAWPLTPNLLKPGAEAHGTIDDIQSIPFDSGQIDPYDPAHFRFKSGPDNSFIDGWLGDDDKVHLEVRNSK